MYLSKLCDFQFWVIAHKASSSPIPRSMYFSTTPNLIRFNDEKPNPRKSLNIELKFKYEATTSGLNSEWRPWKLAPSLGKS